VVLMDDGEKVDLTPGDLFFVPPGQLGRRE
jgi:uncharacterized cupin superfamily protein